MCKSCDEKPSLLGSIRNEWDRAQKTGSEITFVIFYIMAAAPWMAFLFLTGYGGYLFLE